MNIKRTTGGFLVPRGLLGLAVFTLSFVLALLIAATAQAPAQAQEQVRDKDNDVWTCTRQGASCEFGAGRPNCDSSQPSQESQLRVCGWVASNCGCEKAYKDKPAPAATTVPATEVSQSNSPTPVEAPPPPDNGGGHDRGDDNDNGGDRATSVPPAGPVVIVTRAPTPPPYPCYDSWEELQKGLYWPIELKFFLWAEDNKLIEYPVCPDGPVYPDEAALDILALPAFANQVPYTTAVGGFFFDILVPELLRKIELYKALGFVVEEPTFLLCNVNWHWFCPKGSPSENPLDIEEGYTLAWWSKVGPGRIPLLVPESFFEKYPKMRDYPSSPYIAEFYKVVNFDDREGPQYPCPQTTPYRNCDIRLKQWYEALWLLHKPR